MENILNINAVIFTVMGYPMSYIEFIGTIFNLWCVWLTVKGKISSWPVGIVGIVFYIFLFYQIRLYSDLFEQFYFLVMSFYGWWLWLNISGRKKDKDAGELKISVNSNRSNWIYGAVIILGTAALTYFVKNINSYFPAFFPEPASYPFLDAFTTVMSFAATVLMAKKKVECWYLWILVDIIGIGLYFVKDVRFISLEYVLFLGMAIQGLIGWRKEVGGYGKEEYEEAGIGFGEVRPAA